MRCPFFNCGVVGTLSVQGRLEKLGASHQIVLHEENEVVARPWAMLTELNELPWTDCTLSPSSDVAPRLRFSALSE